MLTPYRGSSTATTPAASGKALLVTLSGPIGVSDIFGAPVAVTHAATPYTIADGVDGTDAPERTFLCDTSGGVLTINLPATPRDGEIINIKRTTTDGTALTIGRNGKNIEGAAANISDTNTTLVSYALQYSTTSSGWWII